MPPSELERAAREPLRQQSADDFITRLVEEIAGTTGGAVREPAEIDMVEERLNELRALSVAPPPPVPPAQSRSPIPPTPKIDDVHRRSPASIDDVIREAVRSSEIAARPRPVPLPRRRQPLHRSRQRRSYSRVYLFALFLVSFAIGVLLLNWSWPAVPASSGDHRGEDDVTATSVAEPPAARPQPTSDITAQPGSTYASWVWRKVKTYKVDADGAIDFESGSAQEYLADR